MRISDWRSDVCSSDLNNELRQMGERIAANASAQRIIRDDLLGIGERAALLEDAVNRLADPEIASTQSLRLDEAELLLVMALERLDLEIGRASCRERVCQYV